MSKHKHTSMNFTVTEIRLLLSAVKSQRRLYTEQPNDNWDPLLVKLQQLLDSSDKTRTYDSTRALCACGHALADHAPAGKHECVLGSMWDDTACACDRFVPAPTTLAPHPKRP